MKKNYQKHLDLVATGEDDIAPEIPNLDSILELPHPFREASLVKAICDAHRNSKNIRPKARDSALAAWIDSSSTLGSRENQN